jgi:Na+/H+ antiporter NhaD/arsenite permease-like protein
MPWRLCLGVAAGLLLSTSLAAAAEPAPGADGHAATDLDVAAWSVAPFAGLLLAIAILPLVAGHFWHSNRNKAIVAGLFSLPTLGYLFYLELAEHQPGLHALQHVLHEYIAFIILLGSLYTVAGGIVVDLNVRPGPLVNGSILGVGAVLANFIGTTGASMLLIRPYLRINKERINTGHLPIFFIFVVSNLGGLLTPLGDPPLFLGFLRGVDFVWTLQLWPQWLIANGAVLMIFLLWDTLAFQREAGYTSPPADAPPAGRARFGLRGTFNGIFLLGILVAVLLQSEKIAHALQDGLNQFFATPELHLTSPWPEALMVLMGLLSMLLTSRALRQANAFSWGAITEVAVLFVGIFITMIPALVLLRNHGGAFGVTEPWQYFWLTGSLSSFLDNAPTYLTFASLATAEAPAAELAHVPMGTWLMIHRPNLLAAISCGAVFMGANTYIGNGPNFMVKAIADEAGYRTPSFFGYLLYSCVILLPVFALITVLFFG